MADLVQVVVMLAFFGLAAVFVTACEKIIGADSSYEGPPEEPAATQDAA